MHELRLNLVTREWVIIHSERAKKPDEFRQWREKKYVPEYLESCPFCPGNEWRTPDEIERLPKDGGWKIRVIPNKIAALSPDGERERINDGLKHMVTGVGRHEVIIESMRHDTTLSLLSDDEVSDLIRVYKTRFIEVYKDPRIEQVIIFKNQGVGSGTTVMHPHSQIIGTPVVPLHIRLRIDEAMRYFDNTGECLICAMIKDERKDGRRVIIDSPKFISFVPYAALSPFHMWIFPKRHTASFADIADDEMKDLAYVLKATLSRLYHGLDDPDFNYVIRSESPVQYLSEYYHWYISIVPRLTPVSGFQLGSGMYINNTIPEEVADFLRKVNIAGD